MSSPSKTSTGAKAKLVKLGMVNFSKYKKTQLINHFQALYNALKDRMTSGALKEIPPATIELLSHRNILNHKEKGVRILVAQIWCEIFRIVAPEKVPMTSKTLKSIFNISSFIQKTKPDTIHALITITIYNTKHTNNTKAHLHKSPKTQHFIFKKTISPK